MANADLVHDDSISGLVRGILADLRQLVREELALARVELREQAGRARSAAISFGIMAAALGFSVVFLLIAVATAIADLLMWPTWAGFLVVAGAMGALGFVALMMGRSQLERVHAVPHETVSSLKENAAWMAKRLSSDRR